MNTITIELCAEDRARLDRLQASLDAINNTASEPLYIELADKADTATQSAPETPTPTSNTAKAEKPTEAPAAPEKEPAVELSDIQSLVVTLSAKGRKAEVRDIIKSYADRVTNLPKDKWVEVYEKLKALEV